MKKQHFITPMGLALLCSSQTTLAVDFSAEVVVEVQHHEETEHDHTFVRTEVAPTIAFNEQWSIDGVIVLEPLDKDMHWSHRTVDREGVFAEELKLNYASDNFELFAGKFNPGFGTAWDARGIWGEDFAEDYEITEKLGFGASYTLQTANWGAHTLTASTFFSDTSFLSQSVVTSRGRTRLADGGAGNTEDFSSYAISLDGEELAGIAGLNYHIAYRFQEHGDANVGADDESGYAATLNYTHALTQRISVNLMQEYVIIDNFDSSADDYTYNTSSLITTIDDKWNVTLGYTERVIDVSGGSQTDDHLFQVSGGYDFGNGLTLDAGWRFVEESNHDHDTFGLLARYQFDL